MRILATSERGEEEAALREQEAEEIYKELADDWNQLNSQEGIASWRDLTAWQFAGQGAEIVANSNPHQGWTEAWNRDNGIVRQLCNLAHVPELETMQRTLSQRLQYLQGTGPVLPTLTTETQPPSEQPSATQNDLAKAPSEEDPQHVTLDQAAAIVHRSKRTLEKHMTREKNPLPAPDTRGVGGHANEWVWATLRPWLEREYCKPLPEHFPGLRS
jgi:hypothetical protein